MQEQNVAQCLINEAYVRLFSAVIMANDMESAIVARSCWTRATLN
jgi:hypothetical protein